MHLGDDRELLTTDRGGGVFYRAGEKIESMDDAIDLADGGMDEVVVNKLNSVRKKE